jgi:hypothetical protein
MNRRQFTRELARTALAAPVLGSLPAAALGGGAAQSNTSASEAPSAPLLPTVKFGKADITRMIIGSNQFYGYSHFNRILDQVMLEWYTQDRKMEVLHRCARNGINSWQTGYVEQVLLDLKRYRQEDGKMHWILLADFALIKDLKLLREVAKLGPLGIAHHGGVTDQRFRDGEKDKVREFLKAVRDTGVMVGLSTHNPAVIDEVESAGWDIDYYQACLYRVSRTPDEVRQQWGDAPLGEIFFEKDPERMCKVIRATKKPCLAFKLLAAGRRIRSPQQIEQAFRFALENIKPTDAVIVGMFPKFKDEVRENTELTRRILSEKS